MERILFSVDPTGLVFLTVTVGSDAPGQGHAVLTRGLSRLRRLAAWRTAIVGGYQFIQHEPARAGGARAWNVHLHGLYELRCGTSADGQALRGRWQEFVSDHGLPGQVDLRRVYDLWGKAGPPTADDLVRGRGKSGVGWYVSRRELSEYLQYDTKTLAALAMCLPNKRLSARIGSWRKSPAIARPAADSARATAEGRTR